MKGTVVSVPHSEHVVRVSGRTRGLPRARFALHCLQCLGSFLNSLSWKKVCSPAVKTNSVPQSTHLRALSLNSMAGFPDREIARNRPWLCNGAPVAVPCRQSWCCTRGPDRANKIERYSNFLLADASGGTLRTPDAWSAIYRDSPASDSLQHLAQRLLLLRAR